MSAQFGGSDWSCSALGRLPHDFPGDMQVQTGRVYFPNANASVSPGAPYALQVSFTSLLNLFLMVGSAVKKLKKNIII